MLSRKSFFWAERFKSVIVETGDTLINCLAYILACLVCARDGGQGSQPGTCRYFTDSGIIGTKAFIHRHFQRFKGYFECKDDKRGNAIPWVEGIYSMKRLSEKM